MEQIIDEKAFLDKYNFDNYVHITVSNPTTKDFTFLMMIQTGIDRQTARPREEHRTFMVPAGSRERFVGSVANLYLDQMSKQIAQDAGTFGDISDWGARAKYYDDLIVSIDDPFHDAAFVSYEEQPKAAADMTAGAAEVPFAQLAPLEVAQVPDTTEKDRLEAENAELRRKLELASTPTLVPAPVGAPEQPFAETISAPKVIKRRGRQAKSRK